MNIPPSPSASAAPEPGPGALPTDLEPSEAGVAGWFEALDRPPAPAGLEAAVLGAYVRTAEAGPAWPRRRSWMGAAAALLLLALGVGTLLWVARGAARQADLGQALAGPSPEPIVVDDPTVPLYTDLETFGGLGSGEGEAGDLAAAPAGVR